MSPAWIVAAWMGALGGFGLAIDGARRLARAIGAVAHPNPIVRTHRVPVPYLGGPALIATWIVLLCVWWIVVGGAPPRETLARAGGALALAILGTWDDLRAIGPYTKLALQLAVCAAYLALVPAGSPSLAVLHLLVLVSLVNAFNLIDVMDGLLCVVTGIAAIGLLAAPGLVSGATHLEIGVLLAGLAAFFLFNRPPAHIYAGDGGSMPLGFLIGAWILDAPRPDSPLHALARVGLCAAPALELLLLIPARLQRGLSPLRGSPDHFALRLQDQLGWSKRRVLAVTAVAGSLFALAPWLVAHAPAGTAAILAAFAITVGAIAWFALWRIPPRPAVPPAVHPRAVSK